MATAIAVASPAAAAAPAYVALGDSYSSGVGAGDYIGGSGDCYRSSKAYPALWAAAAKPSSFAFNACSGARTDDVINNQLGSLNSATGLVSISVGGNDVGFADVMTTCVLQSTSKCLEKVAGAEAAMDSALPAKLDRTYAAIRGRAPNAEVVVLGYPKLYQLGGSCVLGLNETERGALNRASDHLNTAVGKRVAEAGFAFADVRPAFAGHEICSGSSWIHSVSFPIVNSYHPKPAGQSGGYLPAFRAAAGV